MTIEPLCYLITNQCITQPPFFQKHDCQYEHRRCWHVVNKSRFQPARCRFRSEPKPSSPSAYSHHSERRQHVIQTPLR